MSYKNSSDPSNVREALEFLFNKFQTLLTEDQTIDGKNTFSQNISIPLLPSDEAHAVSRKYVDSVVEENSNNVIAGAGAHNSIYRGDFLGNSVTPKQYASIQSGDFTDLYIGDYWTIGGINYRIAAFDYYMGCGDTEINFVKNHHIVIVPDISIGAAKQMNTSDSTAGAYIGSAMRGNTTGIASGHMTDAIGIINAAFPGHIMQHKVYLANAVTTGCSSAGAWYNSEIEFMNEIMVYGSGIFSPLSNGTNVPANNTLEKTQLPLFRLRPDLIKGQDVPSQNYWLRDVVSGTQFAYVSLDGLSAAGPARINRGIRPAFSIF